MLNKKQRKKLAIVALLAIMALMAGVLAPIVQELIS